VQPLEGRPEDVDAEEIVDLAVESREEEPAAAPPGNSRRTKAAKTTTVVGLRIGSSQIVAAIVRNGSGSPELVQVVRKPLASGIIVAGEVREPEALATALKALFAEYKLPRRGVRLGIASNRIGVRTLEVPANRDPRAFENSIRFRAQELLSIPITDAILDHIVLGDVVTPEGPGHRVLLAFAHRELIDRYLEACKRARIKLLGIDFDAFALLRAVAEPPAAGTAPDRASVAVAIGNERTIFAVAEGDVCDYTRVLEWGGGSLDVGLARALHLTPSQAEPLKRELSFDAEPAGDDLSPVQVEAARAAMRAELQVLARELLASLQYYQSRPESLAIGEILLTGGAAELPGIATELEQLLGVPVRSADPYRRLQSPKQGEHPGGTGWASIAIGLGMEA
jgi:type IV pilus assembly protein PilM